MHNLKYSNEERAVYFNNVKTTCPKEFQKKVLKPKKVSKCKKRKPFIVVFLAALVWCCAMGASFVFNKINFLDPVYLNRFHNKNLNFDVSSIYAPTLKYINNLTLFNTNILTGVPKKGREKVVTINSQGEFPDLKNDIQYILNQYPALHAGVYVFDYNSTKTVEINSDEVFPAASIIKVPVLIDMFNLSKALENEGFSPIDINEKVTFTEAHRTEGSGYLQFKKADVDYTLDYLAKIMIRQSDNSATNMLIERLGGINQVNASIRHWGFSKTQISSFLPDLDGTNTTTPKEIATMLYNIDNQQFLPVRYSAYIKEYMSKVENRTLIRSQIPDDAVIVHKTGDIGKMLGDAAVVYSSNGKKYIMVIMVKRPHNDYSARDLIQKTAKVVYEKLGA